MISLKYWGYKQLRNLGLKSGGQARDAERVGNEDGNTPFPAD